MIFQRLCQRLALVFFLVVSLSGQVFAQSNNPPVITAPVSVTATEDVTRAFSGGNVISADDPDIGLISTSNIVVSLAVSNGTMTLSGTLGLTFLGGANGSSTMSFRGLETAVNNALSGSTYLGSNNFNGNDTLAINVSDQGASGSNGVQQANASVAITVVAANDPPVLTTPASFNAIEGVASNLSGVLLVSAADVDVANSNMDLAVSATNGTIFFSTTTGLVLQQGANGSTGVTWRGGITNLNAALASMSYTAISNANDVDTMKVVANDLGATGIGGAQADTNLITINITGLNDPPSANLPAGPFSFSEDTTNAIASISVSDPDVFASNMVVNIWATNGRVTLATTAGLTFTNGANGAGRMAFRGNRTNLNNALNNLTYAGNLNTNTNNIVGSELFLLTVNDLGNNGAGGAKEATNSFLINIAPVNDRPILSGTVLVTTNEDGQAFIPYSVSDVDSPETPGYQLDLSLFPTNGRIFLSSTVGLTFLVGDAAQTNNTNVVIRGSLTDINNAVSGLLFLPKPNYNGTATVVVAADDLGNTGSGGSLSTSRTVSVVITPVNDAPVLGIPALVSGNQNTNIFIDLTGAFVDKDIAETTTGTTFITVSIVSTNGVFLLGDTNGLTVTAGANGTTNISFQAAISNANSAIATSYFSSVTNFVGTGSVSFVISDNGFTGSGGPGITNATMVVSVLDRNYAPELDASGNMTLTTINEDTTNTGDLVSAIISSAGGNRITDQDPGDPEGIAIFYADNSNGTWQWSTNGGTSFLDVGPVFEGASVLLAATARVRFVPALDYNGTADFNFRAWDQRSGFNGDTNADVSINGSTTAFSTNTENVIITITAVNDAPTLDNAGDMAFTSIMEEDTNTVGDAVSNLVLSAGGDRITDPDAGAVEGIAVFSRDNSMGEWQYSTNGGATFIPFGAVSATAATLLDESSVIRFVPVLNSNGTATILFRAWDETSGANGQTGVNVSVNGAATAFSSAIETGVLVVINANEAPVMDNSGNMSLANVLENDFTNAGSAVSNVIASAGGDRITDLDPGALEGIAIIGADNTNGTWQFSVNAGANWSNVGNPNDSNAVLLAETDLIRFSPNTDFDGTATILFRAWDQATGASGNTGIDVSTNGDPTAFSTNTETAQVTVTPNNTAPVIDNTGDMTLGAIAQGDTNSVGDTIEDIIASAGGDRITDGDAGAVEGFAVTARDNSNGTWQYSTDGGFSWNNFGAVSDASATLLDASSKLRFVPGLAFNGTATVVFRAWDQTQGANGQAGFNVSVNGGVTAFSTGIETARVSVIPPNNAPVIDNTGAMFLPAIIENDFNSAGGSVTNMIASAGGDRITDGDAGALEGIAVVDVDNTFGTWQFSIDSGSNWVGFGGVSNQAAVLLNPDALIRFVPINNFDGTVSIEFRAWDQTQGVNGQGGFNVTLNGDPTAFSTATETSTLTVIPNNVAPVLDNTGAMSLAAVIEDDTNSAGDLVSAIISSAGGDRITDVDPGAVEGIAVISRDNANGVWQYSLNNGGTWSNVSAVADTAALQLDPDAKLRFVPGTGFTGTATVVFRAWDQSDIFGIGATGVDVSVNGGATAYSAASETAVVQVVELGINIAPVLDNSGTLLLPGLFEDAFTNQGDTVSNILASAGTNVITDANPGDPRGIAVTATVTSNGNWQFSTDGGSNWNNFFNPSQTSAIVLADSERIRFVPNANFTGPSGPFTFRAWDRSDNRPSGQTGVPITNNGGLTAYSAAEETAEVLLSTMSDLVVSKQIAGSLVAGAPVLYRVTVTNRGPSHTTNVVVTDILPPEMVPTGTIITNLGNIFEGASRSFFISGSLAANRRGSLTNKASVVSDLFDVTPTNNSVTNITVILASADLVVTKAAAPNPVLEGKALLYTVTVSNKGPSYALGVVVTDSLPAEVTFISASPNCTFGGGKVTCTIGTLPNNAKTSFVISVNAPAVGAGTSLTNVATVYSGDPDPVTNNNTVVFETPVVNGNSPNDFDGDGASDLGSITRGTYVWTISNSSGPIVTQQFGFGTAVPVPADYDGDGRVDFAVYDPVGAVWYISQTTAGFIQVPFGFSGITPVPADYDGDGRADIGVYHPPSGMWYILRTTAGFLQFQFGYPAASPVPADYDGDGKADIAVFDSGPFTWFIMQSTAGFLQQQFGYPGVEPVPCDYDGDEKADIAVFDSRNGNWFVLQTTAGFINFNFGFSGVIAVPGDFDGDDKCDYGVFDPNSATWYLLQSTAGFETFQLGTPGSIPFVLVP